MIDGMSWVLSDMTITYIVISIVGVGIILYTYLKQRGNMKKLMNKIDDKYTKFTMTQKILCWVCLIYLTIYLLNRVGML